MTYDEVFKIKSLLDELSYIDLQKINRYCASVLNKAKYEDLKKIFFENIQKRRILVNIGRGQSVKWQEFELVGLEDDQVIVKDPRNPKSRKRTFKLESVTLKDDLKREEYISGYAINLETGIYEEYLNEDKDKYEIIELGHQEIKDDFQLFSFNGYPIKSRR